MLACKPIVGLELDSRSLAAIDRISQKAKLGKLLGVAVNAGVFNSIFTKSKAPVVGYNITQTDWQLYAEAMKAIPIVTKASINREIDMMILHYQMPGHFDQKHLEFWRGMKNGCH